MLKSSLLAGLAMMAAGSGATLSPDFFSGGPMFAPPQRMKPAGKRPDQSKSGFNFERRMRGKTYPFSSTRQDDRVRRQFERRTAKLHRQLAAQGLTVTGRTPSPPPLPVQLPLAA